MSQKSGRSSPSPKEDDAQLQVPPTRSSRSSTSSQPDVGPQTRSAGLPTNLKLKVTTQMSRLQLMKDIFSKLSNVSTWTVQDLSHTQEQLQDLHKNFSKTHSYFESAWPESCLDHEYFASSVFFEEYSLYQSAFSKLIQLNMSLNPVDSQPSTSAQAPQPSQTRPRLPDISIPTFSGDFSKWPAFRDLFQSLVINSTSISDIERLHYLRTCLSHEPLDTISSLPLTEVSFPIAWKKLMDKYENKRLLLSSQYSKLLSFSLANQKNSTASSLRQFIDSIVNPLQSLKALGEDLEQNNNLLVFHIINRMDHDSRTHWETLISSNNEFPSFAQLMEFLQSRSRALEWTESNQRQSSQESSRSRTTVHTISQKVTAPIKPSPPLISNKSASSNTPISKVSSMPSYTCDDCGHDHFIADCPRFSKRSPQEKADVVLHRILCSNCLGRHHRHSCRTTKICKICGSRHHTLLHDAPLSSKPHCKVPPVPPRVLPQYALTSQKSAQRELPQPRLNTLLATAIAHLITSTGSHTVRLLIDSGSELTFISQDLARKLNISRRKSHVVIVGIHGKTSKTQGSLALTLKSTYDHQTINIDAHILSSSFSNLPSFYTCFQQSLHLQHLKLADPEYHISRAIDIILGADVYGSVVLPQMKKGPPSSPIAQLSIFGWLILGPVCQEQERLPIQSPMFHTVQDEDLHHLLTKFWEQEEIQPTSTSHLTSDEQECENHFVSNHSRLSSGKYVVRLPLKSSIDVLGSSRQRAFRCLQALIRKFDNDPDYSLLYHQFLDEYELLQHMQPVSSEKVSSRYFLPHHGVLKTDSSTTKLRVVFNGSSPTSTGISLNDIMHTGAKLQLDVIDVLMWMKLTKQLYMCKALWHRSQQLMAQLPTSQVQPSHPFLYTLRIESSLFAPVMGGLSSSDTGVMDCLNFLTMDNLRRSTRL
ncbi:uncharacterized protein LOC123313938 [Coccinella septempunctata]|uniref:uncharacterized protein LOC123313938 n=1 Tax=Coccinella septempunctata TaxID=41139 RepID=UPI001D06022C|nr:uncharacterized protein LOC123313938 [Coccinella septempunctata]